MLTKAALVRGFRGPLGRHGATRMTLPCARLQVNRAMSTFARRNPRFDLRPATALRSVARRVVARTPVRFLNLHEYQSKKLMCDGGVRVQRGITAESTEEARQAASQLVDSCPLGMVIKAQIHAGGRGKGTLYDRETREEVMQGGVKLSHAVAEIADYADKMIGKVLVTKQTGEEGQLVQKVLIHESINFDKEFYFAILMDRAHNGPVLVASKQGGMDIEEVAERDPSAIYTRPVDISVGIQEEDARAVATQLGFKSTDEQADAMNQITALYNLFIKYDATQVEINPLVVATDGLVYCVDAKINFDDNAEFRQKEVYAERDFSMEDPREVAASKFNLNYIGLDGNIGCMVNGAGLAMATMDIIKLHGGEPANFLDVGGGANETQVEEAFKILTADPKVQALLVNIFGGIMKCDVIATGIVNAAKKVGLNIPLVVRLEGTNVELGNQILQDSGIEVITASDLDDAAKKAVQAI